MTSKVSKYKEELIELPQNVNYIAITGKMNASIKDKILLYLFNKKIISTNYFMKKEKKNYEIEIQRLFYNMNFSSVIQFNGYEDKKILMFSTFKTNRIIFVHNDMNLEMRTRKNQRRDVLKYAYSNYDKIALVTKDLIEPTKIFCSDTEKFCIVNNIIDYHKIISKSKSSVELDKNTVINIEYDKLLNILEGKENKFITIGRFSPEKGHNRLLYAFNRVWKENKENYLIIIGGHGKEYNNTLNLLDTLECKENVIIIKSISNPYSILKYCNYFVLSSFYEGFGIVIAEADVLGIPVISTDIVGPRNFIKDNNGTLVENSEDGLYNGMKRAIDGKISAMNVDYEKYNRDAVRNFENILCNNNKIKEKEEK